MDLQELLKKTKAKNAKIEPPREPILPKIATKDRPYNTSDESVENLQQYAINLSQTEAKLEPEPEPNLSQTEAKLEPNTIVSKLSVSKLEPKLEPEPEPNLSQTEAKLEPKLSQKHAEVDAVEHSKKFHSLVGLQRNILLKFFENIRSSQKGITDPISVEILSMKIASTKSAVRKAIQRLEIAGFLVRSEYKNGRGGWTKYRLPDAVFQTMLLDETWAKLEPNLSQTEAKLEPKLEPKLRPSSLEEEDIINIKKSSSSEPKQFTQLPQDWISIDFSGFNELSIPFGQNHVRQIFEQGRISAQELQDSISHYSYDLRVTPGRKNAIQNHLGYFLNSLKNGPYAPPKGYKSPAEIAREEYLRAKKEEAERLEKFKSELFETEYTIWWSNLSSQEQKKITSFDGIRGKVEAQRAFKDTVWPAKIKDLSL